MAERENTMSEVKTPQSLLDALQRMATRELSPADLHGQRVSFAMSAVSNGGRITREQVEEIVSKNAGGR